MALPSLRKELCSRLSYLVKNIIDDASHLHEAAHIVEELQKSNNNEGRVSDPHLLKQQFYKETGITATDAHYIPCSEYVAWLESSLSAAKEMKIEDYEIETLQQIRRICPRFLEIKSDIVMNLYAEWSEYNYSAGWVTPTVEGIKRFCEWATTAPCDRKCV